MIEQISVTRFADMESQLKVIDVRSPLEFEHAHVPGAVNIPLFTNDERARIGWTYKHKGQDEAIVLGESFANPRIPEYLERAEACVRDGRVIVLCARGGLRSLKFSQLLESRGMSVYRLDGGYKSYRHMVLDSFTQELPLVILGGRTGCGKTDILKELAKAGEQVIDLEGIAEHRGSAFGGIGMDEQPSSEQFENILFETVRSLDHSRKIWVEDESLNIGMVFMPAEFYEVMKTAPLVMVETSLQNRVERLCREYGAAGVEPLRAALDRIRKRLGGESHQKAVGFLEAGDMAGAAAIALGYYDKCYDYSMNEKNRTLLAGIDAKKDDPAKSASMILQEMRLRVSGNSAEEKI